MIFLTCNSFIRSGPEHTQCQAIRGRIRSADVDEGLPRRRVAARRRRPVIAAAARRMLPPPVPVENQNELAVGHRM